MALRLPFFLPLLPLLPPPPLLPPLLPLLPPLVLLLLLLLLLLLPTKNKQHWRPKPYPIPYLYSVRRTFCVRLHRRRYW